MKINTKYRKKPVVINAFQMTKERFHTNQDWPNWLHEAWNKEPSEGALWKNENNTLVIGTLEGVHIVSENDWIIKGIAGELYPCKPEIFQKTYEEEKPKWYVRAFLWAFHKINEYYENRKRL